MLFDTVKEGGDFGYIIGGGADDLSVFSSTEGDPHAILVILLELGLDE